MQEDYHNRKKGSREANIKRIKTEESGIFK